MQVTYKLIGDGESLEVMNASRPDDKFTKLVHDDNGIGSISFHVCDHACRFVGTPIDTRSE